MSLRRVCGARACVAMTVLALARAVSAQDWVPPAGIPAPPFGIAEVAGPFTHYVDNTHPSATDTGNPNGSPALPRRTIPSSLAGGSAVEVHGGPYQFSTDPSWSGMGSAASPIFVKGVGSPLLRSASSWNELRVQGSYWVIEGFVFQALAVHLNGDHLALRDSEVRDYDPSHNSAAVTGSGSYLVIYGNDIHDNGDATVADALDIHGIKFSSATSKLWILDNQIHENGGDEVQLSDAVADEPWIHEVYIGRNVGHGSRENCVDVKQARDVIVSQNECYDYQPSASSDGTGIVVHNGAERVWVLFNRIHDAAFGVRFNASAGGGLTYVVGNLIYRIHHAPGSIYSPTDPYESGTGILSWNAGDFHVVNNTLYDVDAGISYPETGTTPTLRITNNIVSSLAQPTHHVVVHGPYQTATLSHTLMFGPARIKWRNNATVYNVPSFQAAFPGKCLGCVDADPRFADPAAGDLRLMDGSPAIDAAVPDPVYATFFDRYGIDIQQDAEGRPRPLGAGWDMGAHEAGQFVRVSFDSAADSANENAIHAFAGVTMTTSDGNVSEAPASVQYSSTNGSAQAGADYQAASGTLSFPAGTASASTDSVAVALLDDALDEAVETFGLTLSAPAGAVLGAQRTLSVSILDDDPPPSVSIQDLTLTERNAGKSSAVFGVSLSAPSGQVVLVSYATADGTAVTPADYTAVSGTLSFPPGTQALTIAVSVVGDNVAELDEAFVMDLVSATNAVLADDQGLATIVNDDAPGTFEFSVPSYSVGEAGARAIIAVKRSGGKASGVSVDYVVSSGTATAGTDYTAVSGTLSFGFGVVSLRFTVPLANDATMEPDETVLLALRNPTLGGSLGPQSTAVLTIVDNDLPGVLRLSAASASAPETAASRVFTVKRVGGTGGPVTLQYATSNGSATAGSDYVAAAGVLTFLTGQQSQSFTVQLLGDADDEANETFMLALSNPSAGALGTPSAAIITIVDNDAGGVIGLAATSFSVDEGAGSASLTVTRAKGTAGNVSVAYSISDGSAASPADYTAASGTLTFDAGVASRTISVPIAEDALSEGAETVNIALSAPSGGAKLGSQAAATLSITDNEPGVTLHFGAPSYSISERMPTAALSVVRSGPADSAASVGYATSNASASAGSDYTAQSGTLSFGTGVSVLTLQIPLTRDTLVEGDEYLDVTLAGPLGASLGTTFSTRLTILDDDKGGVIRFRSASVTHTESGSALLTVVRSGGTAGGVGFRYTTASGSAEEGVDYTGGTSGPILFSAGQTSRAVAIPLLPDSRDEPSEGFSVTLLDPTGGGTLDSPATVTVTIVDDDTGGAVSFSVASYQTSEGAGTATISVLRSGGAASDVSVDYAVSDGSADASDYGPVSGSLVFGAGVTQHSFSVPISSDSIAEGNEAVLLSLSNPTGGASLGPRNTATLTIGDDEADGVFYFTAPGFAVAEGVLATLGVARGGSLSSTATVSYAASDGSASAAQPDYAPASGMLTFLPGEALRSFSIATTSDALVEPDETVLLSLSSPSEGGLGTQATATLTITNEDAGGTIRLSPAASMRVESGGSLGVSVVRSGGRAGGVTVQYATSDGSAAAPGDYSSATGTLSFGPGETSRKLNIVIADDALDEPSESFSFVLSAPSGGATLGAPDVSTLSIADNDTAGTIQVAAATLSVSEAAGTATIRVTRTGGAAGGVTVDYATSSGSAQAGADYTTSSGTLVFAAGETTKSLAVPILPDGLVEGAETLGLSLSTPGGGATLGAISAATLYIVDDDY